MMAESRRARAPRGTLDRPLIVRTAAAILNSDGLEAVTTRRIATELDVRPMALYTYFRSKDEILVAIYDELLAEIPLPEPGTGTVDDLRRIMTDYFRMAAAHPELMRIAVALGNTSAGPRDLRLSETLMSILVAQDIERRDAVGIGATLMRFVLGSAALYPYRHPWDEDPTYWQRVRQWTARLSPQEFPALHSYSQELPEFTQEETFAYGLDLILARIPVRPAEKP